MMEVVLFPLVELKEREGRQKGLVVEEEECTISKEDIKLFQIKIVV